MSINLLDLVKSQMGSDLIGKAASFLGESEASTGKAVNAALPALLGGMISKSSSSEGASALMGFLNQGENDGSIFSKLGGLLEGGSISSLLGSGSGILQMLLGDKLGAIASAIASYAGIKQESSSNLLGLAAPLLMGGVGKYVKDQGITSASGLASLLGGQSDFVKAALPAGLGGTLGSILGLGGLSNMASQATGAAANAVSTAAKGGSNILGWVLGGLAALALMFLVYKGCNKPTAATEAPATDTVAATTPATPEPAPAATAELKFEVGSQEEAMLAFIKDANQAIDKQKWFDFPEIMFDSGSAALKPESEGKLNNILSILNAYPQVNLKIGGYTDNTGDDQKNLKLSDERAKACLTWLSSKGVDAARMSAEGYGEANPVASNDTEEGKAKNRRISFSVRQK